MSIELKIAPQFVGEPCSLTPCLANQCQAEQFPPFIPAQSQHAKGQGVGEDLPPHFEGNPSDGGKNSSMLLQQPFKAIELELEEGDFALEVVYSSVDGSRLKGVGDLFV